MSQTREPEFSGAWYEVARERYVARCLLEILSARSNPVIVSSFPFSTLFVMNKHFNDLTALLFRYRRGNPYGRAPGLKP